MLADIGDAFGKVETDDTPPCNVALDSNIIIAILRPHPPVVAWAAALQGFVLPVPVIAEITHGAKKKYNPATHLAAVDQWVRRATVHPINSDTARIFADIRIAIERVGKPIPFNDIWIAATCVLHGVELSTLDLHLTGIPNLSTTVPF